MLSYKFLSQEPHTMLLQVPHHHHHKHRLPVIKNKHSALLWLRCQDNLMRKHAAYPYAGDALKAVVMRKTATMTAPGGSIAVWHLTPGVT
jgi:hypothetical protein